MMNETRDFPSYLEGLIHGIPSLIYVGAAILLCIGLLIFIKWKGFRKGIRFASLLALVEYVALIYCSTVLFRVTRGIHKYDFHPFWSNNDPTLFVENVMNVVVFVPVGLLMGIAFKDIRWWQVLLIGCGISVSIETLQFVFMKGFSELDDVMHNTLGCMIGYGVYALARYGYERISKRSVGVLKTRKFE